MKVKNLAKGNEGRLDYFGSGSEKLNHLDKIARQDTDFLLTFFRARNKKLITDNIVSVKRKCAGDTPLDEIPMGEKVKFIAGDSMEFWGTAIGIVRIEGDKYLEIEIIPGELYFYSYINYVYKKCELLKVVS